MASGGIATTRGPTRTTLYRLEDYSLLTLGAIILALGMDIFLVPFRIAAGHIGGLAIILHYYLRLPVGVLMVMMNLPIFVLGARRFGGTFLARVLYSLLVYSLAVDLLAPWVPTDLTQNPLLATLYGGLLLGMGNGLIFRGKGAAGGLSILARLIHQTTGSPLGQIVVSLNFTILFLAGLAFGWERALYGLVALYIEGKGIEVVLEGVPSTRSVHIISDQASKIAANLMKELGRGVTALHGQGMYSGVEREILLCVVTQEEISRLKELVYKLDPAAFIIISPASEVVGRGFKRMEPDYWPKKVSPEEQRHGRDR